ncbi:alpha/beta fold hydrolase [Actinophytocola oryzae]|uniref:Pimeloyl-ACP methyl ester carboxylesterase n=1 Tax=Actinophytocola oryzae TaxID=502181 RepID=A0A4R7V0D4_9PSEU|nr:alpha/beta fold hydrolase [Actinophytocola oryzae]TDV42679.1 pimeloyl-ACP methyl ester carboxylesterase [Actinophytocola oryzae]
MTALHLARHAAGGDPVLLLLHGLGATGEVWHELLERGWPGEVLAPDLPGHGRSPRLDEYTFEAMAASVASVLPAGRPVVVLGHSLGGVLALTLAAGSYGVVAACGLGIKLRWSAEELERAAGVAARPERVFATREEAVDRWLRVSGLAGLVPPSSPLVGPGVVAGDDGWRVAVDPRAFGVGAPDVPSLLARASCPTVLAAGERDPMCPREHLLAVSPTATLLAGVGHNAHVEDPSTLWPLLDRLHADVDNHPVG